MPLARRIFRGCKVWVEVDEAGKPVADPRGRVAIRYRQDVPQPYSARLDQLAEVPPSMASERDAATPGASAANPGADDAARPPARPRRRKVAAASKARTRRPEGARALAAGVEPIIVYADGACFGNPGPAGIGVLLEWKGNTKEVSQFLGDGTNNIAELTAIEVALQQVKNRSLPVRVHTDSAYSIGVLSEGWKAKANLQLIARVQVLMREFDDLKLVKVRGHAGDPRNERVDQLARDAITRRA
jgi:ribonuclease HI